MQRNAAAVLAGQIGGKTRAVVLALQFNVDERSG